MSEIADKIEVGRSFIFAFCFLISLLASIYRLWDRVGKKIQILLQFICHNVLPGITQAQRSSGPTKSLRQSFGGKDFIKNNQVAPFHFAQFLGFLELKWKYSQGNRGKYPYLPVPCQQQWGMIGHQSRDPFPPWILSHYTGYQYCFFYFVTKDKCGTQKTATL